MINSRTHGIIDYAVGILLLVAPYLFHFANGGAEQWVPQIVGALVLLMSLVTAYEVSVAKLIPYRTHLRMDLIQAAVLVASPWLFNFAARIWWPHVVVGVLELLVVALSWSRSASATRTTL